MTTIQVKLTDELKAVVEREVAEGGFESAEAYLQSLVHEAQRRRARRVLDAKLVAGSGGDPNALMTRENEDAVERMASLAAAVEEMKAGMGRPIEAMFTEMEARLAAARANHHG